MAVRYIKEETVATPQGTGRFVVFGALGSVFVGFGVVLLLLAVLRFFQEQFEVFRRHAVVDSVLHRRRSGDARRRPDRLAT